MDESEEIYYTIEMDNDTGKLTTRKSQESCDYSDDRQEKDKAGSLHQSIVQVTPEYIREAPEDTDTSDGFSKLKKKYLKRIVSKYQKARTNAMGIIKSMKPIKKKYKVQNEMDFKSKAPKLFRKKKKYVIQAKKDIKMSKGKRKSFKSIIKKNKYVLQAEKEVEILKEQGEFPTEPQDFKYLMPRGVDSKNSKPEAGVLRKVTKSPPPTTSIKSKYMLKLCEAKPTIFLSNPLKYVAAKESSNARSAEVCAHFKHHLQSDEESSNRIMTGAISNEDMEVFSARSAEVWAHFKHHLQSNEESSDRVMTGAISNEDMEPFSRPSNRNLKDPLSRNAKDRVPVTRRKKLKARVRKINRIAKQNEKESMRKWIVQQIRDKEVVLKFKIIEGKYSQDVETRMSCIEKAKYIQSLIDKLFSTLGEHDKLENTVVKTKSFWRLTTQEVSQISPTETTENLPRPPLQSNEDSPGSPTKSAMDLIKSQAKDNKDSEYPETYPRTLRDLFDDLFRTQGSESYEYILEILNPKVLLYEYHRYSEVKKSRDKEGEKLKYTAKRALEEFYIFLEQYRSSVKSRITRPELRTLANYRNYVDDLQTAVFENYECLCKLTQLATSIIFPLMSYESLSQTKLIDIENFLDIEREYLSRKSS